jgi:hypothetical protein
MNRIWWEKDNQVYVLPNSALSLRYKTNYIDSNQHHIKTRRVAKYQSLHPEMKTIVSSLINERNRIQQEIDYSGNWNNQNDQQPWSLTPYDKGWVAFCSLNPFMVSPGALQNPWDVTLSGSLNRRLISKSCEEDIIKKLMPFSPIDPYYGPSFSQECIKIIPWSLGLLKHECNEPIETSTVYQETCINVNTDLIQNYKYFTDWFSNMGDNCHVKVRGLIHIPSSRWICIDIVDSSNSTISCSKDLLSIKVCNTLPYIPTQKEQEFYRVTGMITWKIETPPWPVAGWLKNIKCL